MPAAWAIPWTSSGEVSARTRIARRARRRRRARAASGFVTIGPLATPGEAGSPVASGGRKLLRLVAIVGGSASSGATRSTAARRETGNASSSAMSTAIRSAACGLRLPTRTWSSHSRPSSIVNSMSHRSA